MSRYFVADPEPQEIWGFLVDLKDGEPPSFHQCQDEGEARARTVHLTGVRHFRKLAKRTLGPVEIVED